jgi:type IV pilus assembly protein PilA
MARMQQPPPGPQQAQYNYPPQGAPQPYPPQYGGGFGPPPQQPKSGGASVVLIIIFATLGVVVLGVVVFAVLGIYGTRKYLANAKTAEARNNLGQLSKDASSAYDRESMSGTLTVGSASAVTKRLCASAANAVPSSIHSVQGMKYQSSTSDWVAGDANTGWQCLRFNIMDPQYYQYSYERTGGATGGANGDGFKAVAHGDLNGDGVTSTFTMTGQIMSGIVNVSPAPDEVNPEE